jgi:type 1 fimbriae regulatory protein FimB
MPSRSALKLVLPAGSPEPPDFGPPKRRRHASNVPPYLTFEEVDRFFAVIDSPRDRAIFRLMYHAGLRASEVGMVEMRDYSPKAERVFIRRLKKSNSGEHHMVREEARALRAWLKQRGPAPGAIFISNRHTPISQQMLDVLCRRYGTMAGIPEEHRHCHVWKHTCCTHLFSKGYNVEQVQDWVGHKRIENTMIYGHITNARRQEMAERLRDSWR